MSRWIMTVLMAALPAAVFAHVDVPSDFRDVVSGAALIVRGHVTNVRAIASELDGVETVATVAVDTVLKGTPVDFVDVHVPGGVMGRYRYTMTGAPVLQTDEQGFFFLARAADNSWHLVRLTAGLYVMHVTNSGQPFVESPIVAEPSRTTTAQPVVRGDTRRRPMSPDEFSSVVRVILAGNGASVPR
jgi:hypothetical protein